MRALSGKAYHHPIPDFQSTEQGVLTSSQGKAEASNPFFVQQIDLAGRDSTAGASASSLAINPDSLATFSTSPTDV